MGIVGCAVHRCGASCYKHHSTKAAHICRHGFYYKGHFQDINGKPIYRRRRGKELRACMAVCRDSRYSMTGKVLTIQVNPWECVTNHTALVSGRGNCDVQTLNRVLPCEFWMDECELEPELETGDNFYPQRYANYSLGPQPHWGWMQIRGTTPERKFCMVVASDWEQIFSRLAQEPTHRRWKDS